MPLYISSSGISKQPIHPIQSNSLSINIYISENKYLYKDQKQANRANQDQKQATQATRATQARQATQATTLSDLSESRTAQETRAVDSSKYIHIY